MSDDFFSMIGIHLKDLIGGFAGGLAYAFRLKKADAWSILGSIVVGGLTANYLTATVAKFLGTSTEFTAFVVGLAGMAICRRIIESAGSFDILGKFKND